MGLELSDSQEDYFNFQHLRPQMASELNSGMKGNYPFLFDCGATIKRLSVFCFMGIRHNHCKTNAYGIYERSRILPTVFLQS